MSLAFHTAIQQCRFKVQKVLQSWQTCLEILSNNYGISRTTCLSEQKCKAMLFKYFHELPAILVSNSGIYCLFQVNAKSYDNSFKQVSIYGCNSMLPGCVDWIHTLCM